MQADADGNGTIDYDEFITATMHMNRMDRDEHLYTAFQYFDKDNSGYITIEELEQALREKGLLDDGRDINEIISEVDADNVSSRSSLISMLWILPGMVISAGGGSC
jgi:calcium-dependent protein kinase